MKLMIASDLHGSAKWCERLLNAWRAEGKPRLLLLGDLLYHGPRNDLPEEYAPRQVIAMLDAVAPHLMCVRGNCDAAVDQMVLSFPVLADYCALLTDGHLIYATHGHMYNPDNPPPLCEGDALLFGHTHVPLFRRERGITFINPGSISMPKQNTPHSYVILQDGVLTWKDAQGEAFDEQRVWEQE